MADKPAIMPFGKYRGKPLSILETDPGYCDWILSQPSIKREHPLIYNFVINNCAIPSDTPEHNYYQTRFLERPLQMAALQLAGWVSLNPGTFVAGINKKITELNSAIAKSGHHGRAFEDAAGWKADLEKCLNHYERLNSAEIIPTVDFECNGWDVLIKAELPQAFAMGLDGVGPLGAYYKISLGLEIKPAVGDDFPQALRQVKANARRSKPDLMAVAYKDFDVSNLPIEKVKAVFEASGFVMFSFEEIEAVSKRYES